MKRNIFNGALCVAIVAFSIAAPCGCSTATPASRATTAQYRIEFSLGDSARSNTVTFTFGDGALASADFYLGQSMRGVGSSIGAQRKRLPAKETLDGLQRSVLQIRACEVAA